MIIIKNLIIFFKNLKIEYNKKKFGKVGKDVLIPFSMKNISRPENIFLDDFTSIGSDVVMYATINSSIILKKGSIIAPRCKLLTSNHNYDSDNLMSIPFDNKNIVKDIIIEEGVWIGESVIILPGVTVGKGAVVGSGSVVTKSIPEYGIAVGNPAKVIKYRRKDIFDNLLKEDLFYRSVSWKHYGGKKFVNTL